MENKKLAMDFAVLFQDFVRELNNHDEALKAAYDKYEAQITDISPKNTLFFIDGSKATWLGHGFQIH